MNQVEQWFSILQRKRVGVAAFESLVELASRIAVLVTEWNDVAHPFKWTPQSFDEVLAAVHDEIPIAA